VISRREALLIGLAGTAAIPAAVMARGTENEKRTAPACGAVPQPRWSAGIEGQRKADLGDGRFFNPILAGDYPDPTILKDGNDYYLTHSSFDASPGLLIWHSRDLVNWTPVGPALARPLGTVFAVDLVKHGGRYFIYIPFMAARWSKV
jgi:xylan 1,4-beta-xylosidase